MSSLCRHLKRSGVVLRFRLDISWSLMLWLFSGVTANQRGRVTPYVTASGYGCGVWRPVGRGSGSVCWPASRFAVFWSCWSQCYLRVRFGCFSLVSILEENVLRRLSLLWITRAGSCWLLSFDCSFISGWRGVGWLFRSLLFRRGGVRSERCRESFLLLLSSYAFVVAVVGGRLVCLCNVISPEQSARW